MKINWSNLNDSCFEEDVKKHISHHVSQKSNENNILYNADEYREVTITDLFNIQKGKISSVSELKDGPIPVITTKESNNGILKYAMVKPLYKNKIVVSQNGKSANAVYINGEFNLNSDTAVLLPKKKYF